MNPYFMPLEIDSDEPKHSPFANPSKQPVKTKRKCKRITFHCRKCGKNYQSQCALNHHFKNKHPQNQQYQINQDSSISDAVPVKEKESQIDNSCAYLTLDDKEKLEKISQLGELKEYLDRFLNKKDLEVYDKQINKSQFSQIAQKMMDFWSSQKKEDQKMNSGEIFMTPLTFVLGLFLKNVKQAIGHKYHNFMIQLILTLESEINQHFNDSSYSQNNSAAQLPNALNLVFSKLYHKNTLTNKIQLTKSKSLTCVVLLLLCRWLEKERFTNLKLSLIS